MVLDHNWLLSTAAQSAAALVAIIAGFIINRLLTISAEQNGIKTRIDDLERRSLRINERLQLVSNQLLNWDIFSFISNKNVYPQMIDKKGDFTLNEAVPDGQRIHSSNEELSPLWIQANGIVKTGIQLVKELNENFPQDYFNIEQYLQSLGLNKSPLENFIFRQIFRRFKGELLSKWIVNHQYIGAFDLSSKIENEYIEDYLPQEEVDRKEKQELLRSKKELENQVSELRIDLHNLGEPEGVWAGIFVLIFFSGVGIILPLSFLPLPEGPLDLELRNWIFWSFVSGLLALIIYLIIMVRQLTK